MLTAVLKSPLVAANGKNAAYSVSSASLSGRRSTRRPKLVRNWLKQVASAAPAGTQPITVLVRVASASSRSVKRLAIAAKPSTSALDGVCNEYALSNGENESGGNNS